MTGALIRLRPTALVLKCASYDGTLEDSTEYAKVPKHEVCTVLKYDDLRAYVQIVSSTFGVVWTHVDNVEYV